MRRYYYFSASYGCTIYHCQLMSDGLIFLHVLCHINFFCSQPYRIYALSSCRCASWAIASHIFCMDMYPDMSSVVLIVFIFMLKSHISLSLFSSLLLHDDQSATNSREPGLYSMCTMQLCVCRIMHHRHCDSAVTFLPIITTSCFWSVMICNSCAK